MYLFYIKNNNLQQRNTFSCTYVFVIITYVQKGGFFLVQFNRGILEDSDLKYLAFVHKKKIVQVNLRFLLCISSKPEIKIERKKRKHKNIR